MRNVAQAFLLVSTFSFAAVPALGLNVETFGGAPAGTVVSGDMPQGGTATGGFFPDFTVSVAANNGPNSLIIFDSANPTGEDEDLGTPNQDFGGPGIGAGGQLGMPGENSVPYYNLLIIAEDLGDSDFNDIVDDPDDDADGGTIVFDFDYVVDLEYMVVVDIDAETLDFEVSEFGVFIGGGSGSDDGNNSVQVIDLTAFTSVDRLEITFSSSGAIAELAWDEASVSTETETWGDLKKLYR